MRSIRRNDTVKIIAGKDRDKTGKVLMILTNDGKVLVEGVNFVKKHARQTKQNQKGGIIQKEMPIQLSNVMLVCKNCSKPTRVEIKDESGKSKIRVCKKCKEIIS